MSTSVDLYRERFRFAAAQTIALIALSLFASGSSAQQITIASPSGRLVSTIAADANGRLIYSVAAEKQPVLLPSPLGLSVNGNDLGTSVKLGSAKLQDFNQTYPTRGLHAVAKNRGREAIIPITGGATPVAWILEVRVFDDAVALRYRVPGTGERSIDGEATGWVLPAGATIWYQSDKRSDYETVFATSALEALPQDQAIMSDATIQLPNGGGYLMPTEANLVDYSDLHLQPNGPNAFGAIFPHDHGGWKHTGEIISPWRVLLYSRDLNGLVNSDALQNLCPPPTPELANASWIIPGRAVWHWLVNGRPKLEEQRQWVDRAKGLGWEYYLIDDGWEKWSAPNQDQWQCLKGVVDYARSKGVRIWAWVNTKEVTEPAARVAYFKKAKELGLAGLKIDFMGAPNARWVRWYEETLRDAAAAQLMIDFHGCLKPTGRTRTWPNELTREAIHGRENGRETGVHETTLPFTRYVQGPADYTPTDFRANKLKGASYAHELAEAIVFTSPLLCYGGDPQNYLQNEAVNLLRAIPSTWDETIVLEGSAIGEVAGFARRKGNEWFIGVINGNQGRKFSIPLRFLGPGKWRSEIWGDDDAKAEGWKRDARTTEASETLSPVMRQDGGFVARFVR